MTRKQIADKVRDNLNDLGITYYLIDDINDSIQDGYNEVAVYAECIEKNTSITLAPDTVYYDLSILIPDYYRIMFVYHNKFNFFLTPTPDREMISGDSYWELANTQERSYTIIGPKYLGISGTSSNPVGSLRIDYKAQADILTDNIAPKILPAFQQLLEDYATGDMLDQNQEYTKAGKYWGNYNLKLEEYRRKIQLLSKADRVFTRSS